MAYDPNTPEGMVRLLLNDLVSADGYVFEDEEIVAFLALEGGNVKLAAATAIETNASNEALASKVLRTQDLQTDGAKLADALRKHAQSLRDQVAAEDDGFFEIVEYPSAYGPELTQSPDYLLGGW